MALFSLARCEKAFIIKQVLLLMLHIVATREQGSSISLSQLPGLMIQGFPDRSSTVTYFTLYSKITKSKIAFHPPPLPRILIMNHGKSTDHDIIFCKMGVMPFQKVCDMSGWRIPIDSESSVAD